MKHLALSIAVSAIVFSGCGFDSGEKTGAEQVTNENHPDEPLIDLSFWHFATMAMFRMGSPFREDWGEALKKALLPNQRLEGCARGSWDPAGAWGGTGSRVYSTAINVMTLSSFYGCDLVRGNR